MRWGLLLVVFAACGTSRLISATSELDVPRRLDFGRTWVGTPGVQPLRILSRSRVATEIPVSTVTPFFLDAATISVPGGEEVELLVHFRPTAAGAVRGALRVGDVDVELLGEAVNPPTCPADEPCRQFRFEPSTGACVAQVVEDGAPCSAEACLENGRCVAGECVGTVASCDDGDACTRDACAPGLGCQHVDASHDCPAPTDACLAPACDPLRGCTSAPVADGTPCGDVSCQLANVCLQGRCTALVPPDGFPCAEATPCQPAGACRAQQCERPPERVLAPAWTYQSSTALVLFDGVADPQGNFYWVECMAAETMSCGAVSFTGSGLERFRGAAVTGMSSPRVAQLFDEGRFVFLTPDAQLTAVSGVDGHALWTRRLDAELALPGDGELSDLSLLSDGRGRLWVSGVSRAGQPGQAHGVVQVDAATGAVRASLPAALALSASLVADEWGNVYAASTGGSVSSWSPAAQPRFTAPRNAPWSSTVAAYQGQVLLSDNVQLAVPALSETRFDPAGVLGATALLLSGGRAVRLRLPARVLGPPPVLPSLELALFDAVHTDGVVLGTVGGPSHEATQPFLAGADTVVVAGKRSAFDLRLAGVALDGRERFSCALEPLAGSYPSYLSASAGFTGARFAVLEEPICAECLRGLPSVLRVFDAGALGLAPSGWMSPRGTPGRAGRPR